MAVGKRAEVHFAELFDDVLRHAVQNVAGVLLFGALDELVADMSAQKVCKLRKKKISRGRFNNGYRRGEGCPVIGD